MAVRVFGILLALALVAAENPKADFSHVEVRTTLEAGASYYNEWPSGKTIHAGMGYLPPYGPAEYWCGVGFKEAEAFPREKILSPWMTDNAIDTRPLFCIYRTKAGDIYAYDVLVGAIEFGDRTKPEERDSLVNFIVGGTGMFKGATGVWVGTASGRGAAAPVSSGLKWPKSIIKQMEGYLRLPKSKD